MPSWRGGRDGDDDVVVAWCAVPHEACSDAFGAALEQEQPDALVRPIAYISVATLDYEVC